MKHIYALLVLFTVCPATADVVADNNKSKSPPFYPNNQAQCTAELLFKPVNLPWPVADDTHSYIVVTGENGTQLELRGGTEKRGPAGNPFGCADTGHDWGVVVPYMGKHGKIVDGAYSPDGNVTRPVARKPLGRGAQANTCKMANCVMTVMKAMGQSCKKYIVGVARMRNSNTFVSMALASCGVRDGKPGNISASGWGENWD